MSRSIDAIWRSKVARQLESVVADRELYECASRLEQHVPDLLRTAEEGRWQEHYNIALQVCRISRRVRFRFVEPQCFDRDTKSEILRLLTEAYKAIRSDDDAPGVTWRVKSLNEIKANVSYRIDRIIHECDQPLFEAERSASEAETPGRPRAR